MNPNFYGVVYVIQWFHEFVDYFHKVIAHLIFIATNVFEFVVDCVVMNIFDIFLLYLNLIQTCFAPNCSAVSIRFEFKVLWTAIRTPTPFCLVSHCLASVIADQSQFNFIIQMLKILHWICGYAHFYKNWNERIVI